MTAQSVTDISAENVIFVRFHVKSITLNDKEYKQRSVTNYEEVKAMSYTKDPRYNASGCLDLTAYEAERNIERERKATERDRERLERLLSTIFYICDLAGFHVEGRIVFKDKKTGKIWR